MLRRLLNIASIVCLIACVALMGMWVRSESHGDLMHWYFSVTRWFQIPSAQGLLAVRTVTLSQPYPAIHNSNSADLRRSRR
jgi:hypothetical protein